MRIILAIMLTASVANANEQNKTTSLGTLLSAVDLSGAAATRTFYVGAQTDCSGTCDPTSATDNSSGGEQVLGFTLLNLSFYYTHSAGGTITTTCTGGDTRGTATLTLTTGTLASGTLTLVWGGVQVTPTLAGSKDWTQLLGLQTHKVYKCVVEHSASAGTLTVKGKLEVE
jgi:hypothetical protein